jgi:hypothetical protein
MNTKHRMHWLAKSDLDAIALSSLSDGELVWNSGAVLAAALDAQKGTIGESAFAK